MAMKAAKAIFGIYSCHICRKCRLTAPTPACRIVDTTYGWGQDILRIPYGNHRQEGGPPNPYTDKRNSGVTKRNSNAREAVALCARLILACKFNLQNGIGNIVLSIPHAHIQAVKPMEYGRRERTRNGWRRVRGKPSSGKSSENAWVRRAVQPLDTF